MISQRFQYGMRRNGCYGALFVDHDEYLESFEASGASEKDASESFVEFCRLLPSYLERVRGMKAVVRYVYGDVDGIDQEQHVSLNLLGYEVRGGINSEKIKRVALQLCIDAQETLHRRPEIETFILVLGCRAYLPIVRHIQKNAREVLIVCDRFALSGDLLLNVGSSGFLDHGNVIAGHRELTTC